MSNDRATMEPHASAHGRSQSIDGDAQPSRIEAQIDAKRADIDRKLSQLESRFSPDRMVDYLKDNGGEIAGNLGRGFKDNPVPFLITGVGLAWLMSAQQSSAREPYYPRYRSSRYDGDARYEEDLSDYRRLAARSGGASHVDSGDGSDGDDAGLVERAQAKASALVDRTGEQANLMSRRVSSAGEGGRERLLRMRERAEARYRRMNEQGRQRYDGMSTSARLHYDRLSDDAAKQYDALSDEARRQYDRARRAAEQASRQVRRQTHDVGQRSANFLREQPLVAAAIGASIGALIGSLLPPSRTEDRYLGAQADRYRDDAMDLAGEKMDTLGSLARQTMGQVREDAERALEQAGDKAEQAVQQADAKAAEQTEQATGKAGATAGSSARSVSEA